MVAYPFKISDGVKQAGYRMGLSVGKLSARQPHKVGSELVLIFICQLFKLSDVVDLLLVIFFYNLKGFEKSRAGILGHFVGKTVTFRNRKGRILEKTLVQKYRVGTLASGLDRFFAKFYHGFF